MSEKKIREIPPKDKAGEVPELICASPNAECTDTHKSDDSTTKSTQPKPSTVKDKWDSVWASYKRIRNHHFHLHFSIGLGLIVVFISVAWMLSQWLKPTHISVSLIASAVTFTSANDAPVAFLVPRGSIPSFSFNDFDKVTFPYGQTWQCVDTNMYDVDHDSYPHAAWYSLLASSSGISFASSSDSKGSLVAMDGIDPKSSPFSLDPVSVERLDKVSVAVTGDASSSLSLFINGHHKECRLFCRRPFQLTAVDCVASGLTGVRALSSTMQYRASPLPLVNGDTIQVSGTPNKFGLHLKVPEASAADILSSEPISISSIEFKGIDDHSGSAISTLTEAHISYVDVPKIPNATVAGPDFLNVSDLHNFRIEHIGVLPNGKGISIIMDGVADKIDAKHAGEKPQNLIPSQLDVLLQSPYVGLVSLFSGFVCIIGYIALMIKESKDVK